MTAFLGLGRREEGGGEISLRAKKKFLSGTREESSKAENVESELSDLVPKGKRGWRPIRGKM